ncbi:MAG: dTDP-4-dehydrorhamnose reductase [Myxococcota bacterium]
MSAIVAGSRWLVTGAGGQLGRAVLGLSRGEGVTAVGVTRAELDVCDADAVKRALDEHQPDVVLNCAAFTAVDRCESETAEADRANALAPALLAQACRGGPLLVHVSTDFVFDGRSSQPIPEDAPTRPLSSYGRGKLRGEEGVRAAAGDHLIVRAQWVFGAGGNFVRTILRAAAQGAPLRVVEDQIGRPTWAASLARGITAAVAAGARGTLHVANEGIASWFDLARAVVDEGAQRGLCAKVGVQPIPTSEMPRPATRPAYGVLSLARARSLGIHLSYWREALREYLDAERAGRDA